MRQRHGTLKKKSAMYGLPECTGIFFTHLPALAPPWHLRDKNSGVPCTCALMDCGLIEPSRPVYLRRKQTRQTRNLRPVLLKAKGANVLLKLIPRRLNSRGSSSEDRKTSN